MNNVPIPTFWRWFFLGLNQKAGYRRIANWWGLFHFAAGAVVAFFVNIDIQDLAKSALLPLMAILVGLTFSWAGNVNAIMQTDEVQKFLESKGGAAEYVFTFQLCILINISVICVWCIPLLQFPYILFFVPQPLAETVMETGLFAAVSLAVRSGWHAVIGSNMLLLHKLKK